MRGAVALRPVVKLQDCLKVSFSHPTIRSIYTTQVDQLVGKCKGVANSAHAPSYGGKEASKA